MREYYYDTIETSIRPTTNRREDMTSDYHDLLEATHRIAALEAQLSMMKEQCRVSDDLMGKHDALEKRCAEYEYVLNRIQIYPVHSEPVGAAHEMQDKAYNVLKGKESHLASLLKPTMDLLLFLDNFPQCRAERQRLEGICKCEP